MRNSINLAPPFLTAGLVVWVLCATQLCGEEVTADQPADPAGVEFFEKRVRPVLVEHCYECHSSEAEEEQGGLRLDSRAALRRGGESGPAVVPGSADESLLISAIRYEDLEMPPDGKLPEQLIADLVNWVERGAPNPRIGPEHVTPDADIDLDAGRDFWAFRPLQSARPAPLADESGPRGAIDRFVSAELNARGLAARPPADKYTLLRRIYLDLVGLPPDPEEIADFVNDSSARAYERVVERLLNSPHFGERWGRHWLDLAQYADTVGTERLFPNRGAWRYRDYVVGALNEDKPLDRFIMEQVAGDLLPYESDAQRAEQIVATQFLTQGPMNLVNQFKEQLRMDIVDNQVDKVGRVFLGLTFGCARCHDHKFDPVAQSDYYALAGILHNVQVLNGHLGLSGVFSDWLQLPIPETEEQVATREQRMLAHQQRVAEMDCRLEARKAELTRLETERNELAAAGDNPGQRADQQASSADGEGAKPEDASQQQQTRDNLQEAINKLNKEVKQLEEDRNNLVKANDPRPPTVLAASEPSSPKNARINVRGNALELRDEVPRGIPRVLANPPLAEIPDTASGRLQLAQWLVHHDNPIAPRVLVNRVWHHLFGTGIVRTVDNFGRRGERPTHPELLDYLAIRLVDNGWRIKELIREIVLSRTYRLSSDYDSVCWSVDPGNRLLWRHSPRRLDAEAVRDSLLKISGTLDRIAGGPTLPDAIWVPGPLSEFVQISEPRVVRETVARRRRIYLPVSRAADSNFEELDPLLLFDFPAPNEITGARQSSTTPTQSLFMMNSPFVSASATDLAVRLLACENESDDDRAMRLYLAVYGRPAAAVEIQQGLEYVDAAAAETSDDPLGAARRSAFAQLCQAILMSTEFLTHD